MIKENEGTFAFLFDALSDGICISNGHGDILYMNPAAERLLEITEGEARSRNFCELLCGHLAAPESPECMSGCPLRKPDSDAKSVTYCGRHNVAPSFLWQGERISRCEKWKDLRIRCLRMPGVVRDHDELEKHFTLIEDVSAEAQLEQRKEEWRSMMAHDLRSPLTNIIGSLAMLDDAAEGEPVTAEHKQLVGASLRAGRRMLELLNDYLDMARLDAGKMPVRLQAVWAAKLAKTCVEEAAAAAQAKGIQVSVEVPENLIAQADPDLLFRVFQNLVSNALKFTPEKGRVTITGRNILSRVCLSFRDTGIGIDEEGLSRLFERFQQIRARREGRPQGSGLGLAFCKEALKLMDGSIHVESQPGKGSEFTIDLPAASEQRPEAALPPDTERDIARSVPAGRKYTPPAGSGRSAAPS